MIVANHESAVPIRSSFTQTAQRLLWTGEGLATGRVLLAGAMAWLAFSAIAVAVNGVVPDQDVVPAQVIAHAVRYAGGHPHQIFYPAVFSLPNYLAAALWILMPGWEAISAVRNCLFLWLSVFVPFALAAVLARAPKWGHAAAAFTLSNTLVRFNGVYPGRVYPNFNSDGHFGVYMAVLTVVLLLARQWRTGGVLLGLLPAIHATMAIIVWPWAAGWLYVSLCGMSARERRRVMISTGCGVAVCAVLALALFLFTPRVLPEAPYNVTADGPLIYRQFTAVTDIHRRVPELVTYAYLASPVCLFGLLALLSIRMGSKDDADLRRARWLLVLGAIIWGYVYGAWVLRSLTGWLPLPVQISMPARFSNMAAILLIPLAVALIARARRGMAFIAVLLSIEAVLIPLNYDRLAHHFAFLILAAAFAAALHICVREERWLVAALLAPAAVGAALAVLYFREAERAVAVFAGGFAAFAALGFVPAVALAGWLAPAACVAVALLSVPIPSTKDSWGIRNFDVFYQVTPFDRELNRWLASHAAAGESILPAMFPPSQLQSKTAHPVVMEIETLYLMTYMPKLAPVIGSMARDLYGVDYADQARLSRLLVNGRLPTDSPQWVAAWRRRTREEWQALGQKYGFRLVLSPAHAPLALPVALQGPVWSLYVIE